MKKILLLLAIVLLIGCKNDQKNEDIQEDLDSLQRSPDSLQVSDRELDLQFQQKFDLKRRELVDKKDQKEELGNLVISKSFYKQGDWYVMDFKYPYLNENVKPSYENFNEYIGKYYLDPKGVEKQILEDKRLCDSLGIPKQNERRLVDYKIFNLNDRLISLLFYKENHYTGTKYPAYTFETLNFDLERSVFMNYEDFFNEGSEEELRDILNEVLVQKIRSGEMYYDCWAISDDDFFDAKNNFVINDDLVEFYFDDCVICPSYTGTYSIAIPLKNLMPVLRKYKKNPLIL